jgi:hypothetical protein
MSKVTAAGVLLLLPSFLVAATDLGADKGDALARGVAERYMKAVLDRDVDAVMKLVDVPWCHDAREIIKDKAKLREKFRDAPMRPNAFANAKVHIREVATLEKLREKKKGPPARQVSLGEVVGKDDRVVFVEVEHDGRFQPVWLGVRLEKGEARVVGFVD